METWFVLVILGMFTVFAVVMTFKIITYSGKVSKMSHEELMEEWRKVEGRQLVGSKFLELAGSVLRPYKVSILKSKEDLMAIDYCPEPDEEDEEEEEIIDEDEEEKDVPAEEPSFLGFQEAKMVENFSGVILVLAVAIGLALAGITMKMFAGQSSTDKRFDSIDEKLNQLLKIRGD